MKASEILIRAKEIFFAKLAAKTSWGRNEIMAMYNEAMTEALMEALN
jgi:hypothetical protein